MRTVVLLTYDHTLVGTVTRLTSGPPTNCVWLCTTMYAWLWSRLAAAYGSAKSVPVALSKICSMIVLPTIELPSGLCATGSDAVSVFGAGADDATRLPSPTTRSCSRAASGGRCRRPTASVLATLDGAAAWLNVVYEPLLPRLTTS